MPLQIRNNSVMSAGNWTSQEKLAALMRLPWSIRVEQEAGGGPLVAHVGELPDAVARGDSIKALGKHLWISLSESLARRLERGESIPLPPGRPLPWDGPLPSRAESVELRVRQRIGYLIIRVTSAAA